MLTINDFRAKQTTTHVVFSGSPALCLPLGIAVLVSAFPFPPRATPVLSEILILTKHPYNKPDRQMFDTISL